MNTLDKYKGAVKKRMEGLFTPRKQGDENWFALPRWMRFYKDDAKRMPHQGSKECARRVRQIEEGVLREANRGTVATS